MDRHELISGLIVLSIVGGVFFLAARRLLKERPLSLRRLWVLPALLAIGLLSRAEAIPPSVLPWIVGAAVLGAAFGWLRALTMTIVLAPETGEARVQGSPLAVVLLFLLAALRFALHLAANSGQLALPVRGAALDLVFLSFAEGLLLARAAEMTLRVQRLRRRT